VGRSACWLEHYLFSLFSANIIRPVDNVPTVLTLITAPSGNTSGPHAMKPEALSPPPAVGHVIALVGLLTIRSLTAPGPLQAQDEPVISRILERRPHHRMMEYTRILIDTNRTPTRTSASTPRSPMDFITSRTADAGRSILLGQLKDSMGVLLPPNEVLYAAFEGIRADMVYRYRKGSFEASVILREQPLLPREFKPESTLIELATEFLEPPRRILNDEEHPMDGDPEMFERADQMIDFGDILMVRGQAFAADAGFILTQPVGGTVSAGSSKTFTVVAEGKCLLYQWYLNGVSIAGANAPTYTLTPCNWPTPAKTTWSCAMTAPSSRATASPSRSTTRRRTLAVDKDDNIWMGGGVHYSVTDQRSTAPPAHPATRSISRATVVMAE
jgi:hypothetical protein